MIRVHGVGWCQLHMLKLSAMIHSTAPQAALTCCPENL